MTNKKMPLIGELRAFFKLLLNLLKHFNTSAQGSAESVVRGKHSTKVLQVFSPNRRPTKAEPATKTRKTQMTQNQC